MLPPWKIRKKTNHREFHCKLAKIDAGPTELADSRSGQNASPSSVVAGKSIGALSYSLLEPRFSRPPFTVVTSAN